MQLPENYKEEIIDMLADKLGVDTEEITESSNLEYDLGADSLDKVELIQEIENIYNCQIPDELVEDAKTVNDLFEILEKL